ncbi:helix-turn-helix domain-containing protein [Motilibacter deserti]|uniref:helix-turn-helix domain-containing protein n=1 Tax=Motilibacter deserti TaxID=2714956 RepID=UPI002F2B4CF3
MVTSGDAGDGTSACPEPRTLAQKLDYLFRQVHPRDRGEYSLREVAAGIERAGGPTISPTYLMYLRKGQRTNPTMQHLEAIARFFGVPMAYFLDDATAAQVTDELDLVAALRDEDVRAVALHVAELSPEGRAAVARMVEQIRQDEEAASGGETPGD